METKLKIRDFIYLDVERMKSIYAQIYEGLNESSTEEKSNKKAISGKGSASGGIPILSQLKGELGGEILWENKETETKTLHDHMYNIIEEVLKEQDSIYVINEDNSNIKKAWKKGTVSNEMPDDSFILIKGRVMIDDYERFSMIADNFEDLEELLGGNQNSNFEPKMMTLIMTLIKVFYQNELFVKVLPYSDNPYLRFIGNLKRESLRDSIESITFKYGTNPVSNWYLFGQIASIFPIDHNPEKSIMESKYGKIIQQSGNINTILNKLTNLGLKINSNYDLDKINLSQYNGQISKDEIETLKSFHLDKFDYAVLKSVGIDMVFEPVFNGVRIMDHVLSAKFPSITFTPIAIYRGD